MNKPKSIEEWKEIIVAGPLSSRFRDIPESAENLFKLEKMIPSGWRGRHNYTSR